MAYRQSRAGRTLRSWQVAYRTLLLLRQQPRKIVSIHRIPQPVPLRQIAAALAQHRELPLLLDALGDHGNAERMRHRDDCGGQYEVVGIAQHVLDEAAVDLDAVDRNAADARRKSWNKSLPARRS